MSDLEGGIADVGDAAGRAADEHGRLNQARTEGQQAARQSEGDARRTAAAHQTAADATSAHADAHGDLGQSARDTAGALKDANREADDTASAQQKLAERVERTTASLDSLRDGFKGGSTDSKALRQDLQDTGRELETLSRRFKFLSDERHDLHDLAEEAKSMATALNKLDASSRQPLVNTTGLDKAKQDLADLTRRYEQFNRTAQQGREEEQRMAQSIFASRFQSLARSMPESSTEFQQALDRAIAARAAARPPSVDRQARNYTSEGDALVQRLGQVNAGARARTLSDTELRTSYTQVATGLRSVYREMEVGSAEAHRFGSAMDEAVAKSKNLNLARAAPGLPTFFQNLATATDSWGVKVVSLSAELRGLGLVALIGLAQQLDSAVVSLAGGFISVASGAAEAGAAIGGVFVSGLGQLIPMVSVAAAGLLRLRSVFQAVQADQQMQQEAYFQPNAGQIRQLQNAGQMINAQNALADSYFNLNQAQTQVRQSQIALTQARIDALRNIQDLTLAERQAQLELQGANLSLVQAQQAERAAEATGSQQGIAQARLQVQQAELAQRQAQIRAPRSSQDLQIALRFGVSGAPTVVGAEQAVRAAQHGVSQAQQQIAEAQRQLQSTRLQAAQPASQMSQSQATLRYLLGQMSPVERALYTQLTKLERDLRSPNGPLKRITDAFIEPFTGLFTRLNQLLGDPKFLGPVQRLATSTGHAMSSIFGTMFGPKGTHFFEDMANLASRSVPIVTRSITALMRIFENIARAAGPAFIQLSKAWAQFWEALDRNTSGTQNQERLTRFFNKAAGWAEDFGKLAVAVFKMFGALASDAAPSGMNLVQQLTSTIKDATRWIEGHGPQVRQFFRETTAALSAIGQVIVALARAMISLFDGNALQTFATFLTQTVIPGLRDFIRVMGFVINSLMTLINGIPGARYIIEGLVAGIAGLMLIGRVVSAFTGLLGTIRAIGAAWETFKAAATAFRLGDYRNAFKLAGGAFSGDAEKIGAAIKSSGTSMAESVGAAIREAGAAVAVQIKEALGLGGEEAATEIKAAEVQGGATAAGEIRAGESTGVVPGAAATGGRFGAVAGIVPALPFIASAELNAFFGHGGGGGGRGMVAQGISGATMGLVSPQSVRGAIDNHVSGSFIQGALQGIPGVGPILGGLLQFGGGQSSDTQKRLQNISNELKNVGDVSQMSSPKVDRLRGQLDYILHQGDITQKQRLALLALRDSLSQTNLAVAKAAQQWANSFGGIQATTTNVLQATQQQMTQNLDILAANFGPASSSAHAMAQYEGMFTAMWNNVLNNTSAAVRGTQRGLAAINKMLNTALKALGQGGVSLGTGGGQININTLRGQSVVSGLLSGNLTAGGVMSPHAAGGWHPATSGGRGVIVGEGGHDEVTLTTDPRYAPRQRDLLGQYLQRAPHLSKGGPITAGGSPSVYQSPFGAAQVNWGRTDMGVDLNLPVGSPIGTIGNARVTGVLPNWYNQQPLIYYQLLNGPDSGRYVYVAEQISGIPGISATDPRATSSLQAEVGRTLGRGQRLGYYATSGTGIETGWASASGQTMAQATTGYSEGGQTQAGLSFRSFLTGLQHGVITGGNAALQMITTPHLSGATGAMRSIGQGVLNMIARAANSYVGAAGGGVSASATGINGSTLQMMRQVGRRFGWGAQELAAWRQVVQDESGGSFSVLGSPTIAGNTTPGISRAFGFAQFLGSTFTKYLGPYGGTRATPAEQILAMAQYMKDVYGGPLGALSSENTRHWYASGGLIAPWGGRPVPIVAHEGERVVNPPQWNEIGRLTGLGSRGLDEHMGYSGGSPKQRFVTGGMVAYPSNVNFGSLNSLLGGITGNLFGSDPGSASTGLAAITRIFASVARGFDAIGRLGGRGTSGRLNNLTNLLDQLADPNNQDSLLNLLQQSFQRFQNNLQHWIAGLSYRIGNLRPGDIARRGRGGTVTSASNAFGGVSMAGPALNAGNIGETGSAAIDLLTTRSLVEQGTYLAGEERTIARATRDIRRRIDLLRRNRTLSHRARQNAIDRLQSEYNNLLQQHETLSAAVDQNTQSVLQQEQQTVQDRLSQIGDVYQTKQAALQSKQSTAQAYGRYGQLPGIDRALASSAQAQLAALQPVLAEAKRINDPDLIAQIKQQMSELQGTIAQATAQMIQDSMSAIQQQAQVQSADSSMRQTIAQTAMQAAGSPQAIAAAGSMLGGALQLNQSNLQSQLSQYNTLLGQASAAGDQGAVASLTETIDQLTGELAQNTQAIQDNTANIVAQASQFIQARGQFQSGIFGGLASIIQTIGQTTGYTDVGALASLANASGASLHGTQGGLLGQLAALGGGASPLAALLAGASTPQQFVAALSGANFSQIEAGQSSTWINTFEGLVSNLEQNTQAIAQNNQQLAQLNGSLLQPQQWSTTAWSAFRAAIFTGMGNLLPSFQSALPPGAVPSIAPFFGGSSAVAGGVPTVGTVNINHAPTSELDPQHIGARLAYEIATNQ